MRYGPRVETGGKIHDHVRALLKLLRDESIEKISPRYPRPSVTVSLRQRIGNIHAHLAGKAFCIRVAEECVSSLGLARAKRPPPIAPYPNVSNDSLRARCLSVQPLLQSFWREPPVVSPPQYYP